MRTAGCRGHLSLNNLLINSEPSIKESPDHEPIGGSKKVYTARRNTYENILCESK